MIKFSMGQKLINVIKVPSAVLAGGTIGEWFHSSVRVRQGRFLSPTLISAFVERIINGALGAQVGAVIFGGPNITNLGLVDELMTGRKTR